MRLTILLSTLLFSVNLIGQEICDNGIDDDGDTLVDIQDPDCACVESTVLLASSFEERSCCPTDRSYNLFIDCLEEGWVTPTGSADYFNTCGWMGDDQSPIAPLPIPSGTGMVGINTQTPPGSFFTHYESIAKCLDSPMTSGEEYEVSLYVGFGETQHPNGVVVLDITLALYGRNSCTSLPAADNDDCMTNTGWGWELITEIPVSASAEGTWVFASETFTANADYMAIGIGMTCGEYSEKMFHFLDEVTITGPGQENENVGTLITSGDCVDGVVVELLNGNDNADYQWYLDGVAISGATSNSHIVTDASAEGEYQVMVTTASGCQLSEPLFIEIDEQVLDLDGIVEDIDCNEGGTGSIDLLVNSTNQPFSYDWENGASSGFIDGLLEGDYEVTVTDANGCIGTRSFSITAPPPLVLSTSFIPLSCSNTTTDITTEVLGGTPPYNYLWNTGNTNDLLSAVPAGSYELTVTDANACTAEITINVIGAGGPVSADIVVPSTLTCLTETVELDGTASIPSDNVSYIWTTTNGTIVGPADQATAQANSAGEYTLEVTEIGSGCSSTSTVTVVADMMPPIAEAGPSFALNCGDVSVQLDGVGSSDSNTSYLWSTNDGIIISGTTTLEPLVGTAGVYSLEVTNTINGCTAIDQVSVEEPDDVPVVEIVLNDTLDCNRNSLILDAGASTVGVDYDLVWSTVDGAFVGGTNGLFPEVSQPGTYMLEITNLINACSESGSVTVLLDTLRPTVNIEPPLELNCQVSSQELDGTGSSQGENFQYSWTTENGQVTLAENILLINVDSPGDYQLRVENTMNGCIATETVLITADTTLPELSILPTGELNCVDRDVPIIASLNTSFPNPDFQWTTPDGTIVGSDSTAQVLASSVGTYQVTVTNPANGCASSRDFHLTENIDLPVAAAGGDQNLDCITTSHTLGASSSSSNTILYTWSSPNASVPTLDSAATLVVNDPGTYILEVIDESNGCVATDTVHVSQDIQAPTALIAPPGLLTCIDTLSSLDGSGSIGNSTLHYSWSSPDGNLVGDLNSGEVFAVEPGTYQLVVTDMFNGCADTTLAVVAENGDFPEANIAAPLLLTCGQEQINLAGFASSISGSMSFSWTTDDGNIVQGGNTLEPLINSPGTYRLTVEDNDNNCRTQATVQVLQDNLPPVVNAGLDTFLNCSQSQLELFGTAVGQGTNVIYSWSTVDGSIIDGMSTSSAIIDAPGTYVLHATDTANECSATDEVVVALDTLSPIVQIVPPAPLTCFNTTVDLDATSSIAGNAPLYSWTTDNGNIMQNADTPTPTVNQEGNYTLMVTNTDNGCVESSTIVVSENVENPAIVLEPLDTLDCNTSTVEIIAENSIGTGNLSFVWQSLDGDILTPIDAANIVVGAPGSYTLLLTDLVNGCSADLEVAVVQDTMSPLVIIATPGILNCETSSVALDGAISNTGSPLFYHWSTQNGIILSGATDLTSEAGSPGTYTLTVEDANNGCIGTASMLVTQDTTPPLAVAGDDFVLDCIDEQGVLDGSNSSDGSNYSYLWTSSTGTIVDDDNTLSPTIAGSGTYQLVVTDATNGCTATDLVTVITDIPNANTNTVQPPCFGDLGSIAFSNVQGGTPPYLYSVDGGNSLQVESTFINQSPGIYEALIEDSKGCVFRETIQIIQPDSFAIDISPAAVLEVNYGEEIQLVVQTTFPEVELAEISWEENATLSCLDCLRPYARPTETSIYQVHVISQDGCTDEASVRVFVNREFPVYFPNAFSPDNDGHNDVFYPFAKLGTIANIRHMGIYDRWGEAVFAAEDFAPNDPSVGWDGTKAGVMMNAAVFVYLAEVEFVDGRIEILKGDVMLVR